MASLLNWFRASSTAPSAQEARKWLEEGALLLDVRTEAEFAAGHLPQAINIPVQQLPARLDELPAGKAVVVYCRSGVRSASAVPMLQSRGHQVYDLGAMSNGL